MAPISQQPLNGQGVQRISGYKFKNIQVGIRLGTWNVGMQWKIWKLKKKKQDKNIRTR